MVNPSKPSNFIVGELTGGELDFVVENLPKTHPFAGCPGSWMFQQMMLHFGANVTGIRGNWIGPNSDNLAAVNRLTAGGAVRLEEAAKQTWTGLRAGQYGFLQAEVVGTPTGSAGHYTQVRVLFKKQ
jgi:hypothetical protein